ncbi:hypothetical protein BDR03DRAFT_130235 [Suillus americanus]|nr:hypothetical protein BDR03DRAFT_130235 [Suillus americanus]
MGSTGLPMDTTTIISTVLECILYGFLVLMFIGTTWASTYKHDVNRPIICVAILLFILSTAHIIVDIIRLEDGLVKYRNTFPGGPAAFFQDISQPTFFTKNIIYAFQIMLGDGVLIYRCYVVWRSIGIIILPSLLWCGCSAATLIAPYYASQATGGDVFTDQTRIWVMAVYALTLSTNLISSGLLAYRIWMMERKVSAMRATNGTLMPIVRVVVDAALIYSGMLLAMLICFVSDNNTQFILQDMKHLSDLTATFQWSTVREVMRRRETCGDILRSLCKFIYPDGHQIESAESILLKAMRSGNFRHVKSWETPPG